LRCQGLVVFIIATTWPPELPRLSVDGGRASPASPPLLTPSGRPRPFEPAKHLYQPPRSSPKPPLGPKTSRLPCRMEFWRGTPKSKSKNFHLRKKQKLSELPGPPQTTLAHAEPKLP
jgi:hypothetical protein